MPAVEVCERPVPAPIRLWPLRQAGVRLLGVVLMLLGVALAPRAWAEGSEATVVDTRSLEAQVRAWAAPAPGDAHPPRVDVELGTLDPRLRLAPCRRIEPHLPPGQRLWGRSRIGLRCADGPVRWNVYLPVTVRVQGQALVAARAIPAGQEIGPGDVVAAEVDWAADPSPVVVQPQDAVGHRAAVTLSSGEALRASKLQRRQWFSAGEPVRITARGSGYAVSQQGVALTPGIEGQAARIKTDNGKVLVAFPDGQGSASLNLESP